MRKTELTDPSLCEAVTEMQLGLIEVDLGAGVFKKRIAIPGCGKSGGVRTLVATNKGNRWFFVFGFEKNERANISTKELEAVQRIAADLFQLNSRELDEHVAGGALKEICHDIEG